MNYTLHQLRVFQKVCQTRSVTKAAEELHLTQPAVSIQLAQFQQNFAVALTEVVGRRLYVTDFGADISRLVERVLDEVDQLDYRTLSLQGQLSGRLRFSIVGTAQYVLPYFLRDFTRMHPAVDVQVDVTNKAQVVQSLQRNEVDFAMVSQLPQHLSLHTVTLMDNALHLMAAATLLPEGRLRTKDLADIPFVFREQGSGTRAMMESLVQSGRLPVGRRLELRSNEAVKQAIIAGLGCSVMPIISMKHELRNQSVRVLDMKGFPVRSSWRLVWMQQKQLGPVAQSFLDFLKTEKQRIIQEQFKWLEDYR